MNYDGHDHGPSHFERRAAKERELELALLDDALANFKWLQALRNGEIDGQKLDSTDPKIIRERRTAAQFLGERQSAKKSEQIAISVGRRDPDAIDITPEDQTRIDHVMQRIDGTPHGTPVQMSTTEGENA